MGSSASSEAELESAKEYVESQISEHKVVMFSKSSCPYCSMAKDEIDKFKLGKDVYVIIELDRNQTGAVKPAAIQNYLAKKTGGRTVPRVFINGVFLGGGDETRAAGRSGKLEKLLKQCGAI